MRKLISILLVSFSSGIVWSQVSVDKPLEFTSADAGKRQVYGLAYPALGGNGATVSSVQSGEMVSAETADTDTLIITLNPALSSYEEGLQLRLRLDSGNTAPMRINVDGLGLRSIVNHVGAELGPAEIPSGQEFTIVYNGSEFQLTSWIDGCPAGYVSVNKSFCIEYDERPAALFWTANAACVQENGRICSWGDWYYACQKTDITLANMTNGYEWINDADDHASSALIVGNGTCTTSTNSNTEVPVNTRAFRCCYYK